MTTAPDLPIPPAPAPAAAERTPLVLLRPPATAGRDGDAGPAVEFDEALREATPRLLRYATRRLADPHEAEEVVQEAMLRAFQHRHTLVTEDDLMAWLTVVTGRLVIDRLRVRGRTTPVAEVPPQSRAGRDTADVVVARDEARTALDSLEAMPSRQAAVLWAREVEGLRYDEICARHGLSEPTVRSLLHRARRTLRREYALRGGTLPSMGLVALAPWLRGLRFAGRVRDVARKGAGTAAAAATALAVVTVAPLWSQPAPRHGHAGPVQPYVANAHTIRLDAGQQPRPAAYVPPAVSAPDRHATATFTKPASHVQIRALPRACTRSGVGAGCAPPTAPTLYVQLPTHKDIGVSSDWVPIDCASVPSTPVTHCQPSDRKN